MVGGDTIQCCCVIPTVSGRSAVSEDEKWPTVIVIAIAAVFLNQGTMNTLGQIILCYGSGGCSVHCRMFSGILAPTHLMSLAPPPPAPVTTKDTSRYCQMYSGTQNYPCLRTNDLIGRIQFLSQCLGRVSIMGKSLRRY